MATAIKNKEVSNIYLVVCTILLTLLAFASLPMAMMSPMLFDSPGSDENMSTVTLFVAVISFPLIVLFAIPGGWMLHHYKRYVLSKIAISLPILNIIIGILSCIILIVFCDGALNCH
ncbi:hypothetical protein ACJRPK_09815 [Aquimarina sp. 2-A2]|uniref:hypothetical protein n=1 Tax=Aquimarina sp. 2-A2 TaxID=3382644 RepID=UPI00387F319E